MYSGAFVPIKERGSGIGDCDDGGGVVLKRIKARPRWRDCVSFADRAEAMLNSTWGGQHESQMPPNAGQMARDESEAAAGTRCVKSRAMTSVWRWYIPMPQALISAMNLTTWRYRRAGIANRCGRFRLHHSGAEGNGRMAEAIRDSKPLRCNRLACTGSRYTTFSKRRVSKCT